MESPCDTGNHRAAADAAQRYHEPSLFAVLR